MTTEIALTLSIEKFFTLPRGAQLLVAYALLNDQWHMQLLKSDKDLTPLSAAGLITVSASKTLGLAECVFPDDIWRSLEQIEEKILGSVSEVEMEHYRNRKSKLYPWLW